MRGLIQHSLRFACVLLLCCTFSVSAQSTQPAMTDKAQGRTFRYGMCVHQGVGKPGFDFNVVLRRLDELGVDVVRRDFYWDRLQPAEGKWDFTYDDNTVDAYRGKGIDVQAVVAYTARWATTGDPNAKNWLDWARAAPRVDAYVGFATRLAEHYKNRVRLWEIWNEPDIDFWHGTTDQYAELFNTTSAAIHKTDPNATVINGGFAFISRGRNPNFLSEFLPKASQAHWDIWAFHDYMTFAQMLARAASNQEVYNSTKLNIPIWINEGGFHTLNPGGEPEQAVTLAKKIATAPSLGIKAYFWYNFVDDGLDPLEPEHHFGLLRHDLTPKPAFFAYKNLIQQLAGRTFVKRLESGGDASLWGMQYAGTGNAGHVLVLWREGKDRQSPLWIGAEENGSIGETFDLMGKSLDTASVGNGKLVNVTHAPIYIHYTGAKPPVIRSILTLPDKLPLVRNQPSSFEIGLTNPSMVPSTFRVEFAATDNQATFTPATQQIQLPPSGTERVRVSALPSPAMQTGNTGQISVIVKSADDSSMVARIPFEAAFMIPKLKSAASDSTIPEGSGNAIAIKSRDAYVSLFEGQPKPEMQWRGPEDLSASARWAYDDQALYLNIEVQDDTHLQAFTHSDLWKSDSLQCAIRIDDTQPSYLEFGLALNGKSGETGWIYSVPPKGPLAPGGWDNTLTRSVRREGATTRYQVRLPWSAMGLDAPPTHGLRLNFIVNDDDGLGRKGWLQLSEGIGRVKDASLFRLFACD